MPSQGLIKTNNLIKSNSIKYKYGDCSLMAERSAVEKTLRVFQDRTREKRVRFPPFALFVCRREELRSRCEKVRSKSKSKIGKVIGINIIKLTELNKSGKEDRK